MVDKGDNFALHQRTLKASVSSALDARSISAINKKKSPAANLTFRPTIVLCGSEPHITRQWESRGSPESCH
jgi:hypothetical protein